MLTPAKKSGNAEMIGVYVRPLTLTLPQPPSILRNGSGRMQTVRSQPSFVSCTECHCILHLITDH